MSEAMNKAIRQGFGRQQPARRTDELSEEKPPLEEMAPAELADKVEDMCLDLSEAAAVLVAKIKELAPEPEEEE